MEKSSVEIKDNSLNMYTNIVVAVPHSVGVPIDVDWTLDEKVRAFRDRYIDWDTDALFSVEMPNVSVVKFPIARIDVDAERLEHEKDRVGNCEIISEGRVSLSDSQRNKRLAGWFNYRAELMKAASEGERSIIIDCHSFPNDIASDVDICIGYNEDSSKPSEEVIEKVCSIFISAGYSVAHNRPFANAIAPFGYCGHSLMLEVNKRCYLDPAEKCKGEGFDKLRETVQKVYSFLLRS